MGTKIIRVPVDEDLLTALDSLSKEKGQSRAEIIRRACRRYLLLLENEMLDRIYEEGYKRVPEESALGEIQAELSSQVIPEEKW